MNLSIILPTNEVFDSSSEEDLSEEVNIETTSTTTFKPNSTGSNEDESSENEGLEDIYETAEIAIPFSITVAVIIVLCATAVYAKLRKGQMQRNAQLRMQMPNISGGVPMSPAAYQNQAFMPENIPHMNNMYNSPPPMYSGHDPNAIASVPEVYHPTLPKYSEAPPKYEDIAKGPVIYNANNTNDINTTQIQPPPSNSTTALPVYQNTNIAQSSHTNGTHKDTVAYRNEVVNINSSNSIPSGEYNNVQSHSVVQCNGINSGEFEGHGQESVEGQPNNSTHEDRTVL